MEHPPCVLDLFLNDFWLFPKIKFSLKLRRFQDIKDIKNKCDDGAGSYSTTGVPNTFPTMVTSLV
jgi:hypothetical protein